MTRLIPNTISAEDSDTPQWAHQFHTTLKALRALPGPSG